MGPGGVTVGIEPTGRAVRIVFVVQAELEIIPERHAQRGEAVVNIDRTGHPSFIPRDVTTVQCHTQAQAFGCVVPVLVMRRDLRGPDQYIYNVLGVGHFAFSPQTLTSIAQPSFLTLGYLYRPYTAMTIQARLTYIW